MYISPSWCKTSSSPPCPSSKTERLCLISDFFLLIKFNVNNFPDFSVKIILSSFINDRLQGLFKSSAIFSNFISIRVYKNLLYFFSVQFPPFSKYSSKPISLANKHCHQKSYCYNTSFYNGVFEMWRRVILGLSFFLHLH